MEHSINEPSVYGVFTNANLLGTVAAVIGKTPSVKVIVYDGPQSEVKAGAVKAIKAANDGIKIYTFEEFIELGAKKPVPANPPKPEDIACIMYTSGSTGAPKGVLISNANIVASRSSFRRRFFSCRLADSLPSQSPPCKSSSVTSSRSTITTSPTSLSLCVFFSFPASTSILTNFSLQHILEFTVEMCMIWVGVRRHSSRRYDEPC